jgi:eukaryotic-like serine/threonine-protein kinase
MGLVSGQLLAARYRLSRCIGVGGMSEVWQAADTRLERQVAIKVLKPELSGDPEFRQRFHTEARMTASLSHPGIAAVHDYGDVACGAYLVMELVPGDSLATILTRRPRLGAELTLDILEQAGDALQAAHDRGLVHRDIKPGNILITPDGRVKLTDFGIARAIDAAPLTRAGMVMGTAHYLAPEQAAGDGTGPAGDVYSLGVVGYECLAGRRPFGGPFEADNAVSVAMMHIHDRVPPLPGDVSPAARALIEAVLVKDPRQRYGTGGEFAAAVAMVRAGHWPPPRGTPDNHHPPTAILPVLPPPRSRRWHGVARHRVARLAAVLLGVLTLVLGGYLARAALRSPAVPSSAPSSVPSSGPSSVPSSGPSAVPSSGAPAGAGSTGVTTAPGTPRPATPEPTQGPPGPEPGEGDEATPEVLIIPTDYWGRRGSDAVVTAKAQGLIPRVVDDDGELVDPDLRSQCRIVRVTPPSGFVPRGSTLELTCRRGT